MTMPGQTQQEAMRSIARLHRILEASKLLNSTIDLAELTSIILRIIHDEVGTDRGTVFVLDRKNRVLRSLVAQGIEGQGIMVPVGNGIAGTVAASGETIDIHDAYADSRFDSSFDATLGYRTRDIYCMPIVNRLGEIVGVLELMNRTRPLAEEDEEFLAGVSVHVGLALENAQLHREIVEKRRIEQELVLAREIQRNFYPHIPQACGGVEIAASSEMCEAVGGDYLGYFPFDEGRFLIMLGDVSGKGIGAALVMSSLHAACRALVRHVHAIEDVTRILNETFFETTGAGTFVTMLIMFVDTVGKRVHFISAGHNPPLMIVPAGDSLLLDRGGGPPVGLFSRVRYKREISSIEPGTVLVLYTDGVSEAQNAADEQLGMDRLADIISQARLNSASQIHTSIRMALNEFVGNAPVRDDSTLIVLKFPSKMKND
jgi:sigma-B regulation protein RsbU (phosphoserine phosphatase)